MKKLIAIPFLMIFGLSTALGQEPAAPPPGAPPPQAAPQGQPPPDGQAAPEGQPPPENYQEPPPEEMGQAAPPQPTSRVPPPPASIAPPPTQEGQPPPQYAQPVAPPAEGQWVFNTDYGWIWAPNGDAYTYYPSSGYPYTYVYEPNYGWTWLVAPWVYGGTWPWHHVAYTGPFLGRYGWYHGHWGYYHPWGYNHGYRAFYGAHYRENVVGFRQVHPYGGYHGAVGVGVGVRVAPHAHPARVERIERGGHERRH